MSAPPSLKSPATAAFLASPRLTVAPRAAVLGATAQPPRRLSCSAAVGAGARDLEMSAPLDWAARSVGELEQATDLDTFCMMALSPLDGRYFRFIKDLMPFFSEFGLIRYRVLVEVKWLLKLSQIPEVKEVPPFSEEAQLFLDAIIQDFSINDAKEVKQIEKITNHDVKAVEYYLKQKCSSNPEVAKVLEFFHFGCTSEDINNLSHALALKEGVNTIMFPVMIDVCSAICSLATENAHVPLLSKTHGQIEPHDYISKLFNLFVQFNIVLTDFDRDMWSYISAGYFKQIPKAGEVGSSTMPHKINPINFENSEGNLSVSNGLLCNLSMKLPISRLQRDLTDSTVLRNLGVGLGHSLLAYKATMQGIKKLEVNKVRLDEDLEQTWEVLAEPIQTVMRRYGIPEPYEKLKEMTRGQAVTKDSIRQFIEGLDLPEDARSSLLKLTPHSYTGEAENLAANIWNVVDLKSGFKIK
ncbi:unnamed protein product [Triticum turgidum subsp. durum]|uniref:Adenylosuccinate lyase n=1 Tax=Triticum turgidum subsp. durum TaxID=4567 RepID=A0A9R0WC45_TRITD|nr:unnamed protein product [Triticum turgidum subsp. durum]